MAVLIGCLLPGLVGAYTDAKERLLCNQITLPILLSGLIYAAYAGEVKSALCGFLLAFSVMMLAGLTGGMGYGDVKLAAGLGVWFGPYLVSQIILLGSILALIFGLIQLARRKKLKEKLVAWARGFFMQLLYGVKGSIPMEKLSDVKREETIPYGTFLVIAAWIVFIGIL